MLTPFDDYPIHQTPLPVAHPVSGDPNHYDRYFFNGFDPAGSFIFGAAMGLYPNRQVIDAAFSVVHDGVQHSVFASGRAPLDRACTNVGPITIEVVEPLRVNRLRIDAEHLGIAADLTYRARTSAVEEPRQTIVDGTRTIMDYTRLTQWGTWDGWIEVGGERIEVDGRVSRGTKDRSWGVRGVGEPVPGAPATRGAGTFWLWAPLHFDDECTHLALFEHADGERWMQSALRLPVLCDGDLPYGGEVRHLRDIEHHVAFRPGTRRADRATLAAVDRTGERIELDLEVLTDFQMKGIGYLHPQWGHGRWHGEAEEAGEKWVLTDLDPLDVTNIHIEQLVRVRATTPSGTKTGSGVLEQLIIGAHAPSGFTAALDGAT